MKKCPVCKLVYFITGVGAFNWFFIALGRPGLVASLLGGGSSATRIVYLVIGLCGLLSIISLLIPCPMCKKNA